jgi:hypothetical protein
MVFLLKKMANAMGSVWKKKQAGFAIRNKILFKWFSKGEYHHLRMNSWTTFLVTGVLAWFPTLFCFYKMLFTNRLEFSCFADYFVCTVLLKPQKSMVFFKNPPVLKLWIAWSKRLKSFVKFMSKNSNSDFVTGFVQNYKRKSADQKV